MSWTESASSFVDSGTAADSRWSLRRKAFREVSDALGALEQLGVQREASNRVVKANRERLRVTRARLLSGITSYFEVLDAERQLLDSEIALSQVIRNHHQAVVQLYLALGGGWRAGPQA